jgi:hypothetical protein
MNPFKLSAQFAAYVWFTQRKAGGSCEATRFARDNWIAFLPYADKNAGMLLIEIAKPPSQVVSRSLCREARRGVRARARGGPLPVRRNRLANRVGACESRQQQQSRGVVAALRLCSGCEHRTCQKF